MHQVQIVSSVLEKLEKERSTKFFLIGFDGFIDEINYVVSKRISQKEYTRIQTITEFSERIKESSGLSANIELVSLQTKIGGNGPIMANAILALGYKVYFIGAIGKNEINEVFKEFANKCEMVITLAEPGHTDALEFLDGKIMLGKLSNLSEVNWINILKHSSEKTLLEILNNVSMVAFTNWTMIADMDNIFIGFDKLCKDLTNSVEFFIDLADPTKRTKNDICKILNIISSLSCKTLLGMNENESSIISKVLLGNNNDRDILARAQKIRESLNICAVVIHLLNGACIATKEEVSWVDGPYTEKPVLTTGGGDNFNAGFCLGWVKGFTPKECLITGACTSGFYVRNSYSPSYNELIDFIKKWRDNNCQQI